MPVKDATGNSLTVIYAYALIVAVKENSKMENRSDSRTTLNKTVCFELRLMESGTPRKILYDARCTDISRNGLCLVTDIYLKKGEVLKVLITPDELNTTATVFAEVIWSRFSDGQFTTGLNFIAERD